MKLSTTFFLFSTFLTINSLELSTTLKTHACSIKPQGMIPGKYYASCSDDNYKEIPMPSPASAGIITEPINQPSITDFTEVHTQSNTVEPQTGRTLNDLITYWNLIYNSKSVIFFFLNCFTRLIKYLITTEVSIGINIFSYHLKISPSSCIILH